MSKEEKKVEAPESSPASAPKESETLQVVISASELESLRKSAAEKEEFQSLYQRAIADYQNLRKRMERDVTTRSEELLLPLVRDLLVVLDHLELALQSKTGEKGLQEGVQLIRSEIESALTRCEVQAISAKGKPFDPQTQEAVAQESHTKEAAGTVLEELRRGYRLRERVIRPAQVKIAKADETKSKEGKEG